MEPVALPIPKSDSTTSLSSLISIGNESKNSGPSAPTCIICLGDEGPILSSLQEKSCVCSYHYHAECLKTWYDKHSALCPVCRSYNVLYQRQVPTFILQCSIWQKFLLGVSFCSASFMLVWSIVKNK